MKHIPAILVTILMTWGLAIPVAYAAPVVRKAGSNLPINIKSNELSADNKGKTAVFSGKVVAKQGDITIFCDKMTVYYGAVQGDVDKIEADGNVRIVQGNRTGLAAHAVYDSREGKITLTGGGPKVMQGTDTVSGEVITYFINDERSSVTGGRVEATIHPKSKNDARSKKGNAEQR
ncbi:MAG: lipopolysaccharide transport periplasmic protein LptA [Verrucomicrobia bacterium]|nr:lipopolysaccharide transport periplasmic protein LptA [Deltaproteobacteria bacterium]